MDYGGQSGWRIRRRGRSSRREGNGNHACILEGSLRIDPKRCWGRRATVKEYLFRGLIEQYVTNPLMRYVRKGIKAGIGRTSGYKSPLENDIVFPADGKRYSRRRKIIGAVHSGALGI